jgi:hypothetical protein
VDRVSSSGSQANTYRSSSRPYWQSVWRAGRFGCRCDDGLRIGAIRTVTSPVAFSGYGASGRPVLPEQHQQTRRDQRYPARAPHCYRCAGGSGELRKVPATRQVSGQRTLRTSEPRNRRTRAQIVMPDLVWRDSHLGEPVIVRRPRSRYRSCQAPTTEPEPIDRKHARPDGSWGLAALLSERETKYRRNRVMPTVAELGHAQ